VSTHESIVRAAGRAAGHRSDRIRSAVGRFGCTNRFNRSDNAFARWRANYGFKDRLCLCAKAFRGRSLPSGLSCDVAVDVDVGVTALQNDFTFGEAITMAGTWQGLINQPTSTPAR
jgi:hypothetical protein